MGKPNYFYRFFFEVWLDDSDDEEFYYITPKLYIQFERRRQQYVAYVYDGADVSVEEYDVGCCRPGEIRVYDPEIKRYELSIGEARDILNTWQQTHRFIPEEHVSLCEEEGLYYCGAGTLPSRTTTHDSTQNGEREANAILLQGRTAESNRDVLDIAANMRLVCWFQGVGEDDLRAHFEDTSLSCFDESIEANISANLLCAARMVHVLNCPLEVLLGTDDELFRWILGLLVKSDKWTLYSGTSHPDDGQSGRYRYLLAKYEGGRAFLLSASFTDSSLSDCSLLYFSPMNTESDDATTNGAGLNLTLHNPSPDATEAFRDAYAKAGIDLDKILFPAEGAAAATRDATTIHVNEFLVRRSFGSHARDGHQLDPVRASVSILPRSGGEPRPIEFDAWWCPKCKKHFMSEKAYLRLKRQGYICCKVIEEKNLSSDRADEGLYGDIASESVLHMYGYNVSQRDDLSVAERRAIISFVIENGIQSAQDIARLLEWLISQREGNPNMSVAVAKWQSDLDFVRHYHRPTRTVRVDAIYAKI